MASVMSARSLVVLRRYSVAMCTALLRRGHTHGSSASLLVRTSQISFTCDCPLKSYSTRTVSLLQSSSHPSSASQHDPRDPVQAEAVEEQQNISALVRQLQDLALRCPSSTKKKHKGSGAVDDVATASSTEWSVSADELAALMDEGGAHTLTQLDSSAGVNDSDDAATEGDAPLSAWERGMELANTYTSSAAVAEWLLFLCLSSRDAPNGSAAPFEVCDGVYQAWRRAQSGASMMMKGASSEVGVDVSDALPRSPFHPKGLHHHYAQWLLQEYHTTRQAMLQNESGDVGGDGAAEFDAIAAGHHALWVLNRLMEVLLVDLPAYEAATQQSTAFLTGNRKLQQQQQLRPTTALLVLEASRQLAVLTAAPHKDEDNALTTADLPLLSFLTTPSVRGDEEQHNVHNTNSITMSRIRTPLADVARAAFEHIAATGSPSVHSAYSEALVLYLGFLMASAASPATNMNDAEAFVRCGSPLVRRLAGQPREDNSTAVSALNAQKVKGNDMPSSDRLCSSVAAAVREVLAVYVSERGGTNPQAAAAESRTSATTPSAHLASAFASLLLGAVPAPLSTLFTLPDADAVSGAPQFPSDADQTEDSSPARLRPVSWGAWLLRVLLYDLERVSPQQQQQQQYVQGDIQYSVNHKTSAKDTWQLQSEWTLQTTVRLMMLLRQSSALAVHQRLQQRHRHAHKRKSADVARRPLQELWRLVFQAALRGMFFQTLADTDEMLSCRRHNRRYGRRDAFGSAAQSPSAPSSPPPPLLLRQLCYPHYDKSQWRGPSVNLYMRLLEQWGQRGHVRNVFATVAGREAESQSEVQAAVAAEQKQQQQQQQDAATATKENSDNGDGGTLEADAGSDSTGEPQRAALDRVCRRYHPALLLHSCLITLKACGVSPRAVQMLVDSDAVIEAENGVEEEEQEAGVRVAASKAASEARLAGSVLQYMLCTLHVVERKALHKALRSGTVDVESSSCALSTEGHAITQWVEWIGAYGVPEVEKLYRRAGLEEEWAALGY